MSGGDMLSRTFIISALCLSACGHGTSAEPASPSRVDAPSPPEPAPRREELEDEAQPIVEHVVCSWGTSGVTAAGESPAWVVGVIEVSTPRELRGLRLDRVELLGADGHVISPATTELELRRFPPGRSESDFSRYGTDDFDGSVPAGGPLRLWVHARLDGRFDDVSAASPVRYRAHLVTADGGQLTVEGPLDPPWPTA